VTSEAHLILWKRRKNEPCVKKALALDVNNERPIAGQRLVEG
jgi:hypothetical protein